MLRHDKIYQENKREYETTFTQVYCMPNALYKKCVAKCLQAYIYHNVHDVLFRLVFE